MRLDHPAPFGNNWRARWIWHGRPKLTMQTSTRTALADPRDRIVLFRRELTLPDVPESAPARIWVDGRYIFHVNGVEVARGPVRNEPRSARYDFVDIGPFLRAGVNTLAIVARHFGQSTSWWVPVPPTYSLGAGSLVFECLVGSEWIVSDASWRSSNGEAWTPVPVPGDVACLPLESFDARAHCRGWTEAGFDDSSWRSAFEITPLHTGADGRRSPPSSPFGALRPPVRTRYPSGSTHVAESIGTVAVVGAENHEDPVRQVLLDQESASDVSGAVRLHRFDLGRIAAGSVTLEVVGAEAGTRVDVAASEHVDARGRLVTLGQHAGFRYVCRGVDDVFTTFDTIGTRFFNVAVRGAEASVSDAAIRLSVTDRHRPRPVGASFECSDESLNTIHAIGLRTVDLCALDAYVDCPTREQRAWTGDSVVHQMVDFVSNPDWSMPVWHPQLATHVRPDGMLAMAAASDFAADDQMYLPDWSLHWIRSVLNIQLYTGDRELVAELLPIAERVLRWFESFLGPDDLLHDVTGWALSDWASVYMNGCSSLTNALWARGLRDFAEMSSWLGNEASADWARARHHAVRRAFDIFWDDDRGVYIDHIVDGEKRREAAQHPGAMAIVAGLVPDDRMARVIDGLTDRRRLIRHSYVMDRLTVDGDGQGFVYLMNGFPDDAPWDVENQMVEAEPFFQYVVHDAMVAAGRADLVVASCRLWQVFVDAGETTWPECWVGGTRCHGWSSTPTADLVRHVLGITPAEPGYASVRVSPSLGDLAWARATVPTPHGWITVEAHADGRVLIDSPVPVVGA
jgi:hypothetical protein